MWAKKKTLTKLVKPFEFKYNNFMNNLTNILRPPFVLKSLIEASDSFHYELSDITSINLQNPEDEYDASKQLDDIHKSLEKWGKGLHGNIQDTIQVSLDNAQQVYIALNQIQPEDDDVFPYSEWFDIAPKSTEDVFYQTLNKIPKNKILQETFNFLHDCKSNNIKNLNFGEFFKDYGLNEQETEIFRFNLINNILNFPAGKTVHNFNSETEELIKNCTITKINVDENQKSFLRLFFLGAEGIYNNDSVFHKHKALIIPTIIKFTNGLKGWEFDASIFKTELMEAKYCLALTDTPRSQKIPSGLLNKVRKDIATNLIQNMGLFHPKVQEQLLTCLLDVLTKNPQHFEVQPTKSEKPHNTQELKSMAEEKLLQFSIPSKTINTIKTVKI